MSTLAERIQEILNAGFSQADIYRAAGVSKGTPSQWLNGGIASIKLEYAKGIEKLTKFRADWIVTGELPKLIEINPNITAVHPDDEPRDDIVYVPESKIAFSAGTGRTAQYELIEDEEPATYRLSWFQKYGINPDHVRRFRVAGDSMEPMLYANDTILVNMGETNIIDGRTYAIRYGDELRVKKMFRRLDGTLVLRSFNQAYKDEEVPPELVNEHITVIGRVRDKSGTGGL
jgi:phage repressor protein C with HTH and peptisase S24 domain